MLIEPFLNIVLFIERIKTLSLFMSLRLMPRCLLYWFLERADSYINLLCIIREADHIKNQLLLPNLMGLVFIKGILFMLFIYYTQNYLIYPLLQ